MKRRLVCTIVLTALLAAGLASTATARYRSCGGVPSVYIEKVEADGISCRTAKRKARRSQKQGGGNVFRGWSCRAPRNVATCTKGGARIRMTF